MKKINQKVVAGLLSGMILLSGMAMPAKGEAAYRIWPKTISWAELETMYQNYLKNKKTTQTQKAQTNKLFSGAVITLIPVNKTPETAAPANNAPANNTPATGTPINGTPATPNPAAGIPAGEPKVTEPPVTEPKTAEPKATEPNVSEPRSTGTQGGSNTSAANTDTNQNADQVITPAQSTVHNGTQPVTGSGNQSTTDTSAPANSGNGTGNSASTGNLQNNGYVLDLPGMAEYEKWMFDQVNLERQKQGIAPLQWEPTLNKLARMKSRDMVDKGYFAHQSPTYGSAVDMLARAGMKMWTSGENLAVNSRVESAHYMLMESPGHRANILNGNFTHVGIGIVKTASGGVMITQMFIGK